MFDLTIPCRAFIQLCETEKVHFTWRNLEFHRQAQEKGRNGIFKDYHLRIVHVVREYGMFDREETPSDSKQYHN